MSPDTRPGTPLDPGLIARVAAGVRFAVTGQAPEWFGPGTPPPPAAPPETPPRGWDFPVGYNFWSKPRRDEPLDYPQLRALADAHDLLRLAIETRKDQMERLDWGFRVKEARRTPTSDGRAATLTEFFARPDGENSFARWLRMLMEDMLVVDAATVYPFFDMDGNVLTLEVMDGTLINRVIDDAGRSPPPPRPAFQQVIHGMPARNFTRDELLLSMPIQFSPGVPVENSPGFAVR